MSQDSLPDCATGPLGRLFVAAESGGLARQVNHHRHRGRPARRAVVTLAGASGAETGTTSWKTLEGRTS